MDGMILFTHRAMQMTKPVKYRDLVAKMRQYYGLELQMHYNVPNAAVSVNLCTECNR